MSDGVGHHCPATVDRLARFRFVPQNAINIELCLRITNAKPALAHSIGNGETEFG
jgi:hypothetical protein